MKVVIEFETSDDYQDKVTKSTYDLYDFFYGANNGQVSIRNLKVTKTPSPYEEIDE